MIHYFREGNIGYVLVSKEIRILVKRTEIHTYYKSQSVGDLRQDQNSWNNRINLWFENDHEFDFTIKYNKPENVVGPGTTVNIREKENLIQR